ncbi:MAG: YneF family protein [Erysipelotrichaceae bacterium]|jgi:uncharacterized protein YneF (UPF0154 family)|nr:YneF family protein [Erysipelotrichaceae bacterium]
MNNFLANLVYLIAGGLIGAVISFFVTRKMFEKQLKEHPPIDEKTIRAMYLSMGRKPTEKDIRKIMKSLGQ